MEIDRPRSANLQTPTSSWNRTRKTCSACGPTRPARPKFRSNTAAAHTTADQVKAGLANRFERFKTNDATLASLKQIQRGAAEELGSGPPEVGRHARGQATIEVDIENLEARQKMVEVAQTTSNYQFDDSSLGQVKELVSDLPEPRASGREDDRRRAACTTEIPLDSPTPANIADQVTDYFGGKAVEQDKVVKTEK